MLLGAPDVVPHQSLINPLHSPDDPDERVDSDLPYACDSGYSIDIDNFLGPTRVVGRLILQEWTELDSPGNKNKKKT